MSISDGDSRMANLHLQGVETAQASRELGDGFARKLEAWEERPDFSDPAAGLLRDEEVAYFVIDRAGEANAYWPDEDANDLSESLFREFSEDDRVWERDDLSPLCVHVTYHVLNEEGEMTQILCPYAASGGQVAGFVVVCNRQ